MGRPRRQGPRRAHLVAATVTVLERNGLHGLRVRDVAAEAGVSPASVVYYYPDFFSLALAALDVSMRTLASERAAVAASLPQPDRRLAALIELDLADELPGAARAMGEGPLLVGEHPDLLPLLESITAEHVETYAVTIRDGVEAGVFRGDVEPELVAASLVAQVHALRTARCGGLLSAATGRATVIGSAGLMLDHPLPARTGAVTGGVPAGRSRPGGALGPAGTAADRGSSVVGSGR